MKRRSFIQRLISVGIGLTVASKEFISTLGPNLYYSTIEFDFEYKPNNREMFLDIVGIDSGCPFHVVTYEKDNRKITYKSPKDTPIKENVTLYLLTDGIKIIPYCIKKSMIPPQAKYISLNKYIKLINKIKKTNTRIV